MNRSVAYRFRGRAVVLMMVAAMLVLAHPGAPAQAPASASKPDTAKAGNAENGKKIYKSDGCYQCHGYEGQGGAGTRIGPPSLPLPAFIAYVRQPKNQMPPYTSKVVSDAELADVYTFLQTRPKPPTAKSIPLLND